MDIDKLYCETDAAWDLYTRCPTDETWQLYCEAKAAEAAAERSNEFTPETLEAIRIRYLIVRAGGMASKSVVEDIMILRGTVPDRYTGHMIMNDVECYRLDVWPGRAWPAHYGEEPALADYPEIFEVGVKFYGKLPPKLPVKALDS